MIRWLALLISLIFAAPAWTQGQRDERQAPWPRETLDPTSGLRIWEYPDDSFGDFHLLILVGVGSRDEERDQAGISHMLEHCLFLSTEQRSETTLIKGLRSLGGESNGQTTEDWTAYWVSLPVGEWEYGVDWLTEQIASPGFGIQEFERERGIVIEEVNTRHAHGKAPTFEALLYGDHPYGRSVCGSAATVSRIEVSDAQAWYREHYRLDNLVVAFAGAVPSEACSTRIRSRLQGLPETSQARTEHTLHPLLGPRHFDRGRRASEDRSGFVVLGHLLVPEDARALGSLLVARELLGELLFDEVRTKRGLAYAPRSRLELRDAIWRLDCGVEVGERANLPAVLEGTQLAYGALQTLDADDYERAHAAVMDSLSVSSPDDLLECVERSWTLRQAPAGPDLRAALSDLDLDGFQAQARVLLTQESGFVVSDSSGLLQPLQRLLQSLLLGTLLLAAGIWWLKHGLQLRNPPVGLVAYVRSWFPQRQRKRRHNIPSSKLPTSKGIDFELLERQLEQDSGQRGDE